MNKFVCIYFCFLFTKEIAVAVDYTVFQKGWNTVQYSIARPGRIMTIIVSGRDTEFDKVGTVRVSGARQ